MPSWNTKWQKESLSSSNVRLGPAPCRPQCKLILDTDSTTNLFCTGCGSYHPPRRFFSLAQQYLEIQPILIPHVAG